MNDIKVSLSITLPGSVMFSKEECLKTTQKTVEKKTKTGKIFKKTIESSTEDWDKMDIHKMRVTEENGKNPEVIVFHTRKSRPASQSLNLCKETYLYMVSKECPEWSTVKVWNKMNNQQRLEAHLQRIAEYLGGTLQDYKVFDD